jgi:hypothetical protein
LGFSGRANGDQSLRAGKNECAEVAANFGRPGEDVPLCAPLSELSFELLNTKQVSDPTFRAAIVRFAERTVVELTVLVGSYNFACLILNLDRYPLPDGVKPELRSLHGTNFWCCAVKCSQTLDMWRFVTVPGFRYLPVPIGGNVVS